MLDRHGNIVFTNLAWNRTAEGRLARRPWNYLDECKAAGERGCEEGRIVGNGLDLVMRRELDEFVATYNCPFDERHHWFQISARPARATDDDVGAVVMHTNVTALQHDHLTALPNRALFEAQARFVIDLARDARSAVAVALIDPDGFKTINDDFGHAAGDRVLVRLAQRLLSAADDNQLVARLGGDEFGVVTGVGANEVVLGRLRRNLERAFEEPFLVQSKRWPLGASIGTALYPDDGESLDLLLKAADSRMYGLKRARRSRHEKWIA